LVISPVSFRQLIQSLPYSGVAAAILDAGIVSRCLLRKAGPFALVLCPYLYLNELATAQDNYVNGPVAAVGRLADVIGQ
jgi:hypothetical protein